jgi:hypothetical protein
VTIAVANPARKRRRYQREIEALLEQIRRQVRELRRLKAAGARGRTLADRKQELERARERLAFVVGTRTLS